MNDGPNQESMSGSRVCALTFLLVLGQATLLKVGLLREPRLAPLHPDSFQVHVSPEFAQYPIQSRGVSDDSQWVWKKGRNDSFSAGAIRLLPVDTYRADEAPPGIGWLPLSGIAFSEAPAKASVESKLDAPDGVVKQFELPKASEFKFRKETGVLLEGELAEQGLIEPIRPPSFVPARPLPPTWVEIAMDSAGIVLMSSLVQSSGDPEADSAAIQSSKQIRFQPRGHRKDSDVADASLLRGRVVFRWAYRVGVNFR